jgi:hypothetical protein
LLPFSLRSVSIKCTVKSNEDRGIKIVSSLVLYGYEGLSKTEYSVKYLD